MNSTSDIPVDFTQSSEVAAIVQRAFNEIAALQGEVGALTELLHLVSCIHDAPESAKASSAECLQITAAFLLEKRPTSAVLSALAAESTAPPPRVVMRLVASEGAPRG